MARLLSHPARIRILRFLAGRKTCVCGDIVEELPLAQSTVSQHLRELKEAGFIKGEIEGVNSCYCLDAEQLQGFFKDMGDLEASLGLQKNDCCS